MDDIIKTLISLLEIKEIKIQDILEQTIKQNKAIMGKDVDLLMKLTDQKQRLIDEVDKLNSEFENTYKPALNENSFDIPEIKDKINNIIKIINKIDSLEHENKRELSKQMDEVRQNLKNINLGKKGINGYFKQGYTSSSYIDQKK